MSLLVPLCKCSHSFKHYSLKNIKTQKLDSNLLFASIVDYGCNISLSKMAKISKGINENKLDTVTTLVFKWRKYDGGKW